MATIVIWLIGFLFIGLGCWILLLRIEGLADLIRPHNMSIGQITIDGQESRGYAELFRARFNHHFRRPVSLAVETGFLEVVTLDTPELFQPKALDTELKKMTIEVSGVNVTKFLQIFNQLFQPDQWIVEGDFQTHSDRVLLVLRLHRGERLIRTWYLDRYGDSSKDKSKLLEQLVDDSLFQLVYDFGNKAEHDSDLRKWSSVVKAPTSFPSRAAVAAYYEALGALGRYYVHGDWDDLDRAVDCLQTLRGQMPQYDDGLQLLGMALAERRNEIEAIHVYEQLQLLWKDKDWTSLPAQQKRRLLSIDLLKATATAKLYTWQSTHEAIHELLALDGKLQTERDSLRDTIERAAYSELQAHTAVQLAYTFSLYLSYMRHYMVADIFGSPLAPNDLQVSASEVTTLRYGSAAEFKPIVLRTMKKIAQRHEEWLTRGKKEAKGLDLQWGGLADGERRKNELRSRLYLASGYGSYRMAELENSMASQNETILGKTFATRLEEAEKELREADAKHPSHYLVLQLLGLVYLEPRREGELTDLSIAEQYFERAIHANQSDYYGHELLADVLYRRVANRGVDLAARAMIERGLAEVQRAIMQREISGLAHLLQAQFQVMLLVIERDATKRQELRKGLRQSMDQAARFLPKTFDKSDPDLTWVNIVADILQLSEDTEAAKSLQARTNAKSLSMRSKEEVINKIDELLRFCSELEEKWVAHQRVFQIQRLKGRTKLLRVEIQKATLMNWREIQIPFR